MSKRRAMYALYRTRRVRQDNVPLAIFESKWKAKAYLESHTPRWNKYWIQRIWVDQESLFVFTISEHIGYRTKGFTEVEL